MRFAAAAKPAHLGGKRLRLAGVVAVGDDDHRGPRIDHALGVPAVEGGEALADPRAAADPFRHQRQPVDRARRRCGRGATPRHGRGGCGRRRPPPRGTRRPRRAGSGRRRRCRGSSSRTRRGARRGGAGFSLRRRQTSSIGVPPWEMLLVDGAAEVEAPAAPPRLRPPHETGAHRPRQPRGERVGLGDLVGIDDVAHVGGGEQLGARGALAAGLALAGDAVVAGAGARPGSGAPAFVRAGRPCRARRRALAVAPLVTRRDPRARPAGPVGGEDLVEALPVGTVGGEQRAERRLQRRPPVAAGEARTCSASRVSARPTAKPLSRSVRTKPASRRRAPGPIGVVRCSGMDRRRPPPQGEGALQRRPRRRWMPPRPCSACSPSP